MALLDRLRSGARAAIEAFSAPAEKAAAKPFTAAAPPEHRSAAAPWPLVDRYPTVLGANLSFQSIANVMRIAQTGYRQQMVDLLSEQLERDPHGFAVLSQRILAVAGGRLEVIPAETPDGDDVAACRAAEIATQVSAIVKAIPDFKQSIATLLWALFFGVTGAEISWANDGLWKPVRLHMIHSRRIAYPDQASWAVYIWDQGSVRGWGDMLAAPTNGIYGLRVEDYPGKFIIHAPRLRGEYPTREGLGRELAYWFAMKALAARSGAQYIERFAKPWAVAYWSTQDDGKPRAANDDDIAKADEALRALGAGALSSATLPDSIALSLFGPSQAGSGKPVMGPEQMIALVNAEISKAVQGQTFTTEPGKFGSKGTSNSGKASTMQIAEYDAGCICETLDRDLISWIVRLNWPEDVALMPKAHIRVEDDPDATELVERAVKAAQGGMPVDADAMAQQAGIKLVPREEGDMRPRRMAPLKPVALSELGGTDGASASLDEAARVDAAGITSPTFKKHYKTRLAHALVAGADDITKKRIEKEIAAGVESEVEMHEILAEHVAAGEMQEEPDDVEGDATGRAAE